jgi:hypothetical protein
MRNFVPMLGKNGINAAQEAASSAFYKATCKLQKVNVACSRLRQSTLCPSIYITHFCPSKISQRQKLMGERSQYSLPLISPSAWRSNHAEYVFDQNPVASNSQKNELQLPFIQSVQFCRKMDLIETTFNLKLHPYNNICTSYSINQKTTTMEQFRTVSKNKSFKSCQIDSNITAIREPMLDLMNSYYCMNRNKRRGKRANKGKRPCSHQHRRKRRRRFGSHRR